MGIKQGLNEAFNGYVSSLNSKENFTKYDSYLLDKVGYLKQVLSGERRKKEQGCFWTWESRVKEAQRVLHNIYKYSLNEEEVDVLNGMFDFTFRNKYFVKKFETVGNDSDLCIISRNIASTIENYFDIYSRIRNSKNIQREASHKDNLETIAVGEKERNLAGIGRGKTRVATVALLAAMGLSLFTGYSLANYASKKIIREKEKRIEQLVQESNKPRMIIKTSLSAEEMDKRYEKYAADERAGRLPVLDLTQAKEQNIGKQEGREYYTNKFNNKGVFVQGYMHATNKMQVPPEFSEEDLREKARLQKKWANIGEKVKRDTKKFESGLHDLVTLKHPIGGTLRTISGVGGVLNCGIRGIVRPITYFFTRSDTVDKAIDDFADASYFGDSYNELHGNIFTLNFQGTGDFIQEHPVKSTISVAEDILPFLFWKHGGDSEGGAAASGGGSVSVIPGRSGGAGTP